MKGYQKKNKQADIFEIFPQAINALKKNLLHPLFDINSQNASTDQSPLRSELFTDEQLKKHARMLAKKHIEVAEGHSEHLLKRLSDNESILLDVYEVLTETVKQKARVAPAGEWLLDNFYLIEEQIYTGKKHLPKGYSKGLPQILSGKSAGLPRVYDIAVEIISHSDGFINMESLLGFIEEYQKYT